MQRERERERERGCVSFLNEKSNKNNWTPNRPHGQDHERAHLALFVTVHVVECLKREQLGVGGAILVGCTHNFSVGRHLCLFLELGCVRWVRVQRGQVEGSAFGWRQSVGIDSPTLFPRLSNAKRTFATAARACTAFSFHGCKRESDLLRTWSLEE